MNRAELTVGVGPWGDHHNYNRKAHHMKHKFNYTPVIYIGTCHVCNETHLAEKFGDKIIDGQPVCAACQNKQPATERSEGASASEARKRKSPNA